MKDYLKRVAARLPRQLQWEIRKVHYGRQIKSSRFGADEPETAVLDRYVRPGDWVVDVGANIGKYTWQFSNLVGPVGRVLAIEPVPATFGLLAVNACKFPNQNVTLLNVALSDRASVASMVVPRFANGLQNFYRASLENIAADEERYTVVTMPFDFLDIGHCISLIKIDAEGHDERVLAGMIKTIERDKPTLIVETPTLESHRQLVSLGYSSEILPGSPNTIFVSNG